MKLSEAKNKYAALRIEYYETGNTSCTDREYDDLEDWIRERDPDWSGLKTTGVRVGKKTEVPLLAFMPSLDKIKAENPDVLDRWIRKQNCEDLHVAEKLDGSSIQAVYKNGKLSQLITRGDGTLGKDISYFIPYVKLPATVDTRHPLLVLRIEAIMPISVYHKKYAGEFDSDRALSSAVFNRQDPHVAIRDIDMIVLKIQYPVFGIVQSQEEAKNLGFQTARGKVFPASKCTTENLSHLFGKIKDSRDYSLDGLVLHSTSQRPDDIKSTADRPSFAKAFKVNDEADAQETVITDIVWNVSSFGVLVPKAIIRPIKFGGVTVKQAALHNAKWASDRGAGIGAKIMVIRSGDIIPKIIKVLETASFQFPDKSVHGAYSWDKTKTSLVLKNAGDSPEVKVKSFSRFFSMLNLDDVAEGLAEKLVAAGYENTLQLPALTATEFSALPGVKSSAKNMAAQMKRVMTGEFDVIKLMCASGVFDKGMGETRLRTLLSSHPECFAEKAARDLDSVEQKARTTKGCGNVFAKTFTEGLPKFWSWIESSGVSYKKPIAENVQQQPGPLSNQVFSWTGYRSQEQEDHVRSLGGTVASFGSKTTTLFYRADGKSSTKVEKAGGRALTYPAWIRKTEG